MSKITITIKDSKDDNDVCHIESKIEKPNSKTTKNEINCALMIREKILDTLSNLSNQ